MVGLVTALASAAAVSYAGYATMAPQSQLYGRTLTHGSDPTQIALTFDDGPNDPHTLHLLELLEKHGARATFFLIGKYVRRRPDIVRAIHAAGHAIGNHTENHPNLIFAPASRLSQELESCSRAIEDAIGARTALFRPPFGGRRPAVLRLARSFGLEPAMWSVTGYDWKARSSEEIVQNVSRSLAARREPRGEIVLLHDGSHLKFGADRTFTVQATRALLEKCAGEKKQFVTVNELTRVS
jgi:peptidoglycan/xylan/chitin deacetylase (PgdA/CDA1 family)